jgi:hypothetical protein
VDVASLTTKPDDCQTGAGRTSPARAARTSVKDGAGGAHQALPPIPAPEMVERRPWSSPWTGSAAKVRNASRLGEPLKIAVLILYVRAIPNSSLEPQPASSTEITGFSIAMAQHADAFELTSGILGLPTQSACFDGGINSLSVSLPNKCSCTLAGRT